MPQQLVHRPQGGHELEGRVVENDDIIEVLINGKWIRGRYFIGKDLPTITSDEGDHPGAPLPIVTGTPCRWPAS
jgi:hypothetical protein